MPRVGFEPTISAGERPQTYARDRAATGTGKGTSTVPFDSYGWVGVVCFVWLLAGGS